MNGGGMLVIGIWVTAGLLIRGHRTYDALLKDLEANKIQHHSFLTVSKDIVMVGQGPGLAEEVSVHRDWGMLAQEWSGGEVIEAAGDEASGAAHQGQNLVGSLNVISIDNL